MRCFAMFGFTVLAVVLVVSSSDVLAQKKVDPKKAAADAKKKAAANEAAQDKKFDQFEKSQFNIILGQLKSRFATFDTSRDGFLDEAELAVAFRGKFAKPPMPAETQGTDAPKSTSPPTVDFKKYPDQEFLASLDDDGDRKISLAEFTDWAEDFAEVQAQQMRRAEETRYEIQELQLQMSKASSAAQRQTIENRLQQQRLQLAKQQDNIRDRDRNFQKHRKMKRPNNPKRR
jgi:Ca2+-binding EF-hand superfamily protein